MEEETYTYTEPDTPQVVMKFTLPRDKEWFEASYYGIDWRAVVEEMDEQIHSWIKHGHNFKSVEEALEAMQDFLQESMSARNLSLW